MTSESWKNRGEFITVFGRKIFGLTNRFPQGTDLFASVSHTAKKVPPNLIRLANKAGMGVQLTQFETGKQALCDYLGTLRH